MYLVNYMDAHFFWFVLQRYGINYSFTIGSVSEFI